MNDSPALRDRTYCRRCPTRWHCVAGELEAQDLEALADLMRLGTTYRKGQHLFTAGECMEGQYHLRSGALKSYFLSASGQESVTGFYWPGDIVPNFSLGNRHSHWVVALEDSTACLTRFARGSASRPQGAHSRVLQAINRHTQQMAAQVVEHQLTLKARRAEARLAGFCLAVAEHLAPLSQAPDRLPTPMTRTDIASYLGLTLESLSRAMSRLQQRGVISANRQQIQICDRSALRSLAAYQH